MHAIWKGSVRFSLINIPISLYPASRSGDLSFRLLRSTDLSPVAYKRVAAADGAEVPWDQIVKGYEYEKDRFVVLKDEDFDRADVEATQTIDIIDFVKLDDINPIFFDKPYYLEPQKNGEKAYALLREALKRTERVGISKVVIKTKQHLAALKPQGNALVLELMHFADELVEPDTLKIPGPLEGGGRELEMASDLVKKMTEEWKPDRYTDEYRNAMLKVIQEKIERGEPTTVAAGPKRLKATNVVDLAAMLQQSLEQAKGGAGAAKKAPPRKQKKAAAG